MKNVNESTFKRLFQKYVLEIRLIWKHKSIDSNKWISNKKNSIFNANPIVKFSDKK